MATPSKVHRSRPPACALAMLFVGIAAAAGCGGASDESSVRVDGSSTVFPITEAVAEEFFAARPDVRITVGYSGTGGGIKKFIAGEIDICDASRAMKSVEISQCEDRGVEFIALRVAFDGVAVVVNPENDWCDCLTVDQLKELWRPESAVTRWSHLDPDWPDRPIRLYGPGTDSGTFDYFTTAIVGEAQASRADFTASEDDNVLITGIQSDRFALGYFGLAYYEENRQRLKLLGVDSGSGCQTPARDTVRSNTYRPLSRPLYLYVRKTSLARPVVVDFVQFYLDQVSLLAADVGYIPVTDQVAQENLASLESALAEHAAATRQQEAAR